MTENLHYLLSCHRLFDITIYRSQCILLFPVILGTFSCDASPRLDHHRHHNDRKKGKPHVFQQHDRHCTDNTDDPCQKLGQCAVQQFPDRINIIRETTHDITYTIGIKIAYRHILKMVKEILPYTDQCPLRYPDHDPLLHIAGNNTGAIYGKHHKDTIHQLCRCCNNQSGTVSHSGDSDTLC